MDFCSLASLNRPGANWVRLALLLSGFGLGWKSSKDSWRYGHVKYSRWPFHKTHPRNALDFDQTLGFPGEGPQEHRFVPDFTLEDARTSWVGLSNWSWIFAVIGFGVLFIPISLVCPGFWVGLSRRPLTSVVACSLFGLLLVWRLRLLLGVGISRRPLTSVVACFLCEVFFGCASDLCLWVGLSRRPSNSVVACSLFGLLFVWHLCLGFGVGLSRRPLTSVVACSICEASFGFLSGLCLWVGLSRRPSTAVVACLSQSFVASSLYSIGASLSVWTSCSGLPGQPLTAAVVCLGLFVLGCFSFSFLASWQDSFPARHCRFVSHGFSPQGRSTHKINFKVFFWIFLLINPTSLCHGAPTSVPLQPRDAGDLRRVRTRDVHEELPIGRPVLKQTEAYREKLLKNFDEWLVSEGMSTDQLLGVVNPDIDAVNTLLEKYGRPLFKAGRPYGHYAETINAVASRRPRIRRSLQQAWGLAFAWLRKEPPIRHVALPWQALLSILATSLAWGWVREAGVIALSWGGITRIGEVMAATRSNLVLPGDMGGTQQFALLEIQEPKTRFSTARHQAARLDQPQLLQVIEISFRDLLPGEKLWPASSQTMRNRFQKLVKANRLDNFPEGVSRGLDLGSLRAGGASWLLLTSEDSELTRRRGRWITSKVMEIYVQEVAALQFLPKLPRTVRDLIFQGASLFTSFLAKALRLHTAGVPPRAWFLLFKNEAAFHGNVAERSGLEDVGEIARQVATKQQPCDNSIQHGEKKGGRTELLYNL